MANQQTQSTSNSKNQQASKGMRSQQMNDGSRSMDTQEMDTDYDRRAGGEKDEQKSIGSVISQSLSKGGQESIDRAIDQFGGYFRNAKTYVSENPREAALIAVSAGLAAYVLLTTRPGRKVFDAGMNLAGPELKKALSGVAGKVS